MKPRPLTLVLILNATKTLSLPIDIPLNSMLRPWFKLLSIALVIMCSAGAARAQHFELYQYDGNLDFHAPSGVYHSDILLNPPLSDTLWYYVNIPDSTKVAPVLTLQLTASQNFSLMRYAHESSNTIVEEPINTPIQLPTQRLFASSFYIGWKAQGVNDTAWLSIESSTEVVRVRIIGTSNANPAIELYMQDLEPQIDYDTLRVGTSRCKQYRLTNFSGIDKTITELRMYGYFYPGGSMPRELLTNFSLKDAPTLPYLLRKGDSVDFSVCYNPKMVGGDDDTLLVMAGDTLLHVERFYGSSIPASSVKHIVGAEDTRVFPNPAQSRIEVLGIAAGTSYTITDALGRLVHRGIMKTNTIDISYCTPGLNRITFSNGRQAVFVKQGP